MPKKKWKRIDVEWDDATSCSSWQKIDLARVITPLRCQSRGWLVSKDRENVRVALSICRETGNVSDMVVIPRQWIRKMSIR